MACMEAELCGVTDQFRQGRPDGRYLGRGGAIKIVMRSVMPKRAAGALGRMQQTQYAYVWCMLRLRGMTALARKAEMQGELTEGQLVQRQALLRKFCSPTAPARYDAGDAILEGACDGLQASFLKPKEASQTLEYALT